ncbi:MAG: glycoside hydrolase family 3 N-terminal domain-containing protein [Trebonia sp.]
MSANPSRRGGRRARLAACAAVAACAVAAGCSANGAASGTATTPGSTVSPSSSAQSTSKDDPPTIASPDSACVTQVYHQLTLAQRVGQLFLVAVPASSLAGPATVQALDAYHFGSVLLPKTAVGTAALASATAAIQALAPTATGGVRFLVAANQEGGEIQQLSGPGFEVMPSELVQGTWTDSALRAQAQTWGSELRAAGVNLNLAPVMDVVPEATAASNAPIGALDREFGYDPQTNGEHGIAFVQGMASAGVASVVKHFPGLGRVTGNTDFTSDVVDTVTTADDPNLDSFRAVIDAGVPYVMVAEATYTKIDPSQLAVFSPVIMQLLRSGLGFKGVILSDDLGEAAAVASVPAARRAIDFLNAGGDLITSQDLGPAGQMAAAVLAEASSDGAFRTIVDDAAERVLAAKQAQGLLSC